MSYFQSYEKAWPILIVTLDSLVFIYEGNYNLLASMVVPLGEGRDSDISNYTKIDKHEKFQKYF